jgi:hypothetical protein
MTAFYMVTMDSVCPLLLKKVSLHNLRKNITIQHDYTLRTSLLFYMAVLKQLTYCQRLLIFDKYAQYQTLNFEKELCWRKHIHYLRHITVVHMFKHRNDYCIKNNNFLEQNTYLFYKFNSFK